MDDQECPRCKTTKYRKPTLKLMVNICGHPLCEGCVDLLFLKGTGNCYECNQPLRRGNFRVQLFDDSSVEKEVEIRKKLLKDYNKVEEDFNSLAEYNDYLEEIEEIVFNLCNNIDILETNNSLLSPFPDGAKDIVSVYASRMSENVTDLPALFSQPSQDLPKHFSSGIRIGSNLGLSVPAIVKPELGPLYKYEPTIKMIDGPDYPSWDDVRRGNYLKHVRTETVEEKAGGYVCAIATMRALNDAFAGLYHTNKRTSPAAVET
ncbi:CDK-activating kinase assembly factor MAT1 [Diaphorina citri]|uniref:CDK-activating kinase assembly factor MAT1 n=1 Tax=Diaphorina citri TaxID=121845 RepID=A0A1S4EIS7_DIACI|nr:CDK-activating kinase assembly factor MAT1 [Diaphorina citri]